MKQEPKIIDYPIIKFSMDVHRSTTYSWPKGKDGKGDKLFETDTSLKTFEFDDHGARLLKEYGVGIKIEIIFEYFLFFK